MTKIKRPTAKIVLRKDKKLKNGEHPIALRISFNRKSNYVILKDGSDSMTSAAGKWDVTQGRYIKNRNGNDILMNYEVRAKKELANISDGDFTYHRFEKLYFASNDETTVDDYFNQVINFFEKSEQLNTASVYKDTRNRIREFVNKKSRYFLDIDLIFIRNFENFLIKKGNSINSISIYLRTLRALINKAILEGHLEDKDYPFRHFKIRTQTARKRALKKKYVKKIVNYDPDEDSRIERSHKYFIFSFLTGGMNLKDMAGLRWSTNISNGYINYIRAKTARTQNVVKPMVPIKLEKEILDIINSFPRLSDYVFPIFSEGITESTKRYRIKGTLKTISKDLTIIATELKIPEATDITFYWARHSWATIQFKAGASLGMISERLGHKDLKTTLVYIDSFGLKDFDKIYKNLF